MYAVIKLKGHQYIVKQGDKIVVDNVDLEDGKTLDIDQVLAAFDEKAEKVLVGTPTINAKVVCEVVKSMKGDKITVIKFKRKNRYQRTIGFRPHQTVLEIKSVEVNG